MPRFNIYAHTKSTSINCNFSKICRCLLAYIMIPLIQKEIDSFVILCNSRRRRMQRDTVLPDGILNYIYDFPENYDLRECGMYASNFPVKFHMLKG